MIRIIAPFAALTVVVAPAWAGDKLLYAPVPAWVKPAPPVDMTTITDASPIFLIIDQQERLADGEVAHYVESATRIASPEILAQAGTIQLPWNPDQGDLTVHSASILRGSETIDLLAGGKQIPVIRREQKLEQLQLDGVLTATMPVEGLRVGDVLRLRFTVTRRDRVLGGQVQSSLPLFAEPMRTQFGRVRLIWPEAAPIVWRSYADWSRIQPPRTVAGMKELEIALPLPKVPEMPKDIPVRYRPVAILDAASYPDWQAVSKAMAPLYRTQGLIAPGSALAQEVAAIAAASPEPRRRAAAALRLVQDKVRYLFNGMAQGNYAPQSPAETWSARYGDCKAKSLLLLAILRELGIEAEAVLVHSTLGDLVPKRLPMPAAFDHVIVHATIDGTSLWLDGTSNGDRLEDLGDVPPFRHALPLRMAGAGLVDLPLQPDARPQFDVALDFDQSAGINFLAPVTAKVTLHGPVVQLLRTADATMGKEQRDQMVARALGDYASIVALVRRRIDFDDAAGTAIISATGVAEPGWNLDDGRRRLTVDHAVQAITFNPDRGRASWRDLPVTTGDPSNIRIRVSYRLPKAGAGFALDGAETLPAQLAGRVLRRRASLTGGTVTVEDQLITTGAEIDPAQVPATRRELAMAKAKLLRLVAPAGYPERWQEGRPGAFAKINAILDEAVAADPQSATVYLARAGFRLSVFDYAAAIGDFDRALALAPSADLYAQRASVFDLLGRHDKAIADADKARELDPSSHHAIKLAIDYRASKGDYAGAIAIADEQIEMTNDKVRAGYAAQRAKYLADSGKVEEAVGIMDGLIESYPRSTELFNTRCWMRGTHNVELEAALQDCTKAIELSEDNSAYLDSRALVYFRMGRMDAALADIDAALQQEPDLTASVFMRGVIRKSRGDARAAADLAGARLMSPGIDAEYARYGIKP
ncbi:DUF3857 domain-containing protein [Sphingomonas sp.]|uniref:DUF3857 domain-containing protein n=1 Tax=Sphingomonas sp. TaxID=28214 RepID=UPI001ED1EA4D|nr:DUF3857 domain-containing protein [Sphingomonas sp.]MBX3595670.1 DUF3857 domain-containing protein [Sphingomonas sp.]